MSEGPVVDWHATFKKGVRSKDGKDVGTVVGVSADNIVIQKDTRKELIAPKQTVEGFDGNEVFLKISKDELSKYEIRI